MTIMSPVDNVRDTLSGQAGLLCELLTLSMEPRLKEAGISLATFELLSTVHALKSKGSQAEVARRLGITAPSLSETVKSAVRLGLVEQIQSPLDARTRTLKITARGTRAVQHVMVSVRKAEAAMLQGLDGDAVAAVIEVLKRANKNLARALQDP